jgi:chemotaxis protein MotB
VNISKYHALRDSLKQAFAGQVTEGGDGVLKGGKELMQPEGAPIQPQDPSASNEDKLRNEKFSRQGAAAGPQENLSGLTALKKQIDKYAKDKGLEKQIGTQIDERGLVIRLLTDDVLFDPGRALVKPEGRPVIGEVARIIKRLRIENPIRVEGNTDSTPIATPQFPSNWELSTARATAVLQVMRANGVPQRNLSAAGYADQRPVSTNKTFDGRHLNRRVEVVVVRRDLEGVIG